MLISYLYHFRKRIIIISMILPLIIVWSSLEANELIIESKQPTLSNSLMYESIVSAEDVPPLDFNRIVGEICTGAVGGVIGGATLGALGYFIESFFGPDIADNSDLTFGPIAGLAVGFAIGNAGGVYLIGNIENETGNFLWAVYGSLITEIPLIFKWYGCLFASPVGATVGFNFSRKYKSTSPVETGFINIENGKVSLLVPSIQYQNITNHKKSSPHHNINLLKLNF